MELNELLDLFTKFATAGGGIWAIWGVITLAGGLRSHDGQQTQTGMWQALGGVMIVAAAQLFKSIAI
ncbi:MULTISPECIES: hypothetical protein [Actinotignum]|uniref:Permease n=1 Tax=Actinotignum timonense TaxID=1870995 RepID=A0AAW9HLB3_9ACTO|nr:MULTISPECIES: hypothetical protein [Actinotignum]MDK8284797.1 hypothetical protein [Actinotignum timonense]MDY5127779.1 hypothetical protein [Actinotignum sp. SLA_B059]MDY5130902.1 hypothetical protein [Actinotignum timonense]MDY5140257.1 hypothetical protein [Actinotignum timonense]